MRPRRAGRTDTGPTEVTTPDCHVVVERTPDLVVRAAGQLDHLSGPLLLACAASRVSQRPVLDLTGVEFLDAGELAALAHLARESPAGSRLRLRCGTRRAVLHPLRITGLIDQFDLV